MVLHCCCCSQMEFYRVPHCCCCSQMESRMVVHCCCCSQMESRMVVHCCCCSQMESQMVVRCCYSQMESQKVVHCCCFPMESRLVVQSRYLHSRCTKQWKNGSERKCPMRLREIDKLESNPAWSKQVEYTNCGNRNRDNSEMLELLHHCTSSWEFH